MPRRLFLTLGLVLAAPVAVAQDTGESRMIVRDPIVALMPPLEIDLATESVQRYALVVGNGDYAAVPDLVNATGDAALVADFLRRNGYVVDEQRNLTKRGFEAAMRAVLSELEGGAEFVFYYAGHGVQIGDGNYLLPTDAEIDSIYDVPFEAVSLASVMALTSARARSVVAILDSCRNNPFPDQLAMVEIDGTPEELRTGFTPQESPINSLLIFSTAPDAVAFDGEAGGNSPFTQAFVEVAEDAPGISVDLLLRDIRRRVYEITGRRQLPWNSSSLVEPVVLSGGPFAWPASEVSAGRDQKTVRVSVDLTGDVGRRIDLGQSRAEDRLSLVEAPTRGRVEVQRADRYLTMPTGVPVDGGGVSSLYYSPSIEEVPARSLGSSRGVQDSFTLQVGQDVRDVNVELEVDPCDYEAGDYLDPEGVGVARYPNEIEPAAALAACEAAVKASPEVGRFHYELGRVQLVLRDLEAAEASFERARDLGHTRAWHGLGAVAAARQQAGSERARAPEEALRLFAEGVRRGDPYAYHSLGLQLLLYPESKADRREGFELLSRALELGHTFSMNALGLYFLDADSDHYQPTRGLRYLRESAARGDLYGYANLGFVALTGAGETEPDLEAARDWFVKAAEEGHPTAPASLGRMYNAGQIGGAPDGAEAIRWYDIGLERGDAWGGANAAWIIANRPPPGFQPWDAAVRAAKAAALRNPEAQVAADEVLAALPARALDGGVQALLAELGYEIAVDGAFGPASAEVLARFEADSGTTIPADRIARLKALAAAYWERTTFRVDLY